MPALKVYFWHPEIRQSQIALPEKKLWFYQIFGKFVIFPNVIKKAEFSLPKDYQHQSMEVIPSAQNQKKERFKKWDPNSCSNALTYVNRTQDKESRLWTQPWQRLWQDQQAETK